MVNIPIPVMDIKLKLSAGSTHVGHELFEELVDQALYLQNMDRDWLFEYPHRDDDSRKMLKECRDTISRMLKMLGMTHDPYDSSWRGY